MSTTSLQKKRRTELDILRMLATIAVIATHLCGTAAKTLDVSTSLWAMINSVRAAVTWDVPAFVMISGCLFLRPEKEITIHDIYGKYIKHIAVCFIFWSAVFQLYYYLFAKNGLNWKGIISELLIGPYPFWYLYMLVGLYMIVPFLRKFTNNKQLLQYFIVLFIAFSFITNYATAIPVIGNYIDTILSKAFFHFVLGFTGYYILGYYISQYEVSFKWESVIYALGAIGILVSCVGTTVQLRMQGEYNEWFSKYLMPNVIFESMAIFTLFTKRISKMQFSAKTVKLFSNMTQLGFGVYLIHALVIEVFNHLGITVLSFNSLFAIPILTVSVYLICIVIIYIIQRIPVVGKRIT